MATWRVARSLDTLLAQLNAKAPKRSKVSDGSIGDAEHASRDSDHNPWLKAGGVGVVTARDFTNDPGGGLDCNWLAKTLIASGDPRIKYIIWNRRIYTPGRGWAAYKGINPHDHHLHLSVSSQPGWFDSTLPWAVGSSTVGSPISTIGTLPVPTPSAPEGFLMALNDAQQAEVYNKTVAVSSTLEKLNDYLRFMGEGDLVLRNTYNAAAQTLAIVGDVRQAVTTQAAAFTDTQLAQIAGAVADEQARRQAA